MNIVEQTQEEAQEAGLLKLKDQIDEIYNIGDSVEQELYELEESHPTVVKKLIRLMDEQMTKIAQCQHMKALI